MTTASIAILALLGFSFLIAFHELGHMVAAKAVGVPVTRFQIFFGPAIACVRRGGTEYAIGTIPVGGYVNALALDGAAPWKRVVVYAAGPVASVLLAFLLIATIGVIHHGPVDGIIRAGDIVGWLTVFIVDAIVNVPAAKDLSGPVGIYETTRQAFELDVTTGVLVLAVVSLSIGIFNLLPILPLDGGNILLALVAWIRGRELSEIPRVVLTVAGLVVVLMAMTLGVVNDVGRLLGDGFGFAA